MFDEAIPLRHALRRRSATLLVATVVATALVGFAVQEPAPAAPPPERCPTSQDTAAGASASAAGCHGRVELASARTERGQVFANADGSFTSVRAARVVTTFIGRGDAGGDVAVLLCRRLEERGHALVRRHMMFQSVTYVVRKLLSV